jgi:hypothetical protein
MRIESQLDNYKKNANSTKRTHIFADREEETEVKERKIREKKA